MAKWLEWSTMMQLAWDRALHQCRLFVQASAESAAALAKRVTGLTTCRIPVHLSTYGAFACEGQGRGPNECYALHREV